MTKTISILAAALAGATAAAWCGDRPHPDPAKMIDLTYTISPSSPHWPGEGYHPFRAEVSATLAKDGVYSRNYCSPEHLGTHVDAPNHFESGQVGVDAILLEDLVATAIVFDVSAKVSSDPDAVLTMADIRRWEQANGAVPDGAIALLRTGWGARIGDFAAYKNADGEGNLHFPSFSIEAARFLILERGARALGVDTLSIDPGVSKGFEVHHIVNGAGRYGLENVADLDRLPPRGATLIVAPMKIAGGTGGQARIFAVLP